MPQPAPLHPLDDYLDITADLSDLNAEDTVFRSPTGRTIKVKAKRQDVGFGMLVLHLTGSDCGPDGKAITDGEAWRIGPVHAFTAQADNPGAVPEALERDKRRVADEIERIATVAEMTLPGVG